MILSRFVYLYTFLHLSMFGCVDMYVDTFASSANLKHMVQSELSLKLAVQNYITAEEKRLHDLKR